ncbi:ATPase/histidine kinase/DNA gyrase B/HSP90 domain protein [Marvinbryantia formatexigens DSM 14469]|uniref:histidine kinase n=1 Tax=Marvinbryantia formatexigens DSM 14469 TaxID=478749 RepID=C6LC43_9FIRM|nr:HAMP domain-containing sensor histidine kinase [Marvinbryantia formatexigens]EET61996.1 ATPase/histidine kinase/DNA gyrase B/HSP90 domain protein [Marvinbryantia formatexigens DSM 14469]UWO25677.1 HAMP domain-containing histidine kinase [Marvinbryantia formatexigens DSM 14469]SDF31969.1 Signal transduction histidine kinase [Marvinbryantia formatexigens]
MTESRKWRLTVWLPVLVCVLGITGLSLIWLQQYRQAAFAHISEFSEIIIENDPEAEAQVLSALKEYCAQSERRAWENQFLRQYGYREEDFREGTYQSFFVPSLVLLLVMTGVYLTAVRCRERHSGKRIAELTGYLERVNAGASGTVMQKKEDEFSCLQDEIYKTVTALRRTKETAVQAKENFADNLANIAHQLKTPVTAALLSLQLMEKTAAENSRVQIERQLLRLNRLEEALLTLSKLDAGVLHLERAAVDVYTVFNLAAENLQELLERKGIAVDIPERGCVEFCGDMEWSMEALMNLMKNCMEHSARGGVIHCDYSGNPLYTEMKVWDEGAGFLPEDIPHLFERFYRGKDAKGDGTGIGLFLARSIFELQGGSITARNLPEGGACFEIKVYCH